MAYHKDLFTRSQFLASLKICFPARQMRQAVAANGRASRERMWPQWLLAWTLIAWFFQATWGLPSIVRWLRRCCRTAGLPSDVAIYQARQRLGYKPLWWIRRHLVNWLACPKQDTHAFFRGRRLIAIDGTTFTMADTPANARTFGRAGNQHKSSAFPLLRLVALCELGTHALVHWLARPYRVGEHTLAARLLHFVPKGSLLLADRNFHSYAWWEQAKNRGFDSLVRIASGPKFPVLKRLSDGSYLSKVRPRRANHDKPPIWVRVIQYEIQQGSQVVSSRLLTSLLNVRDGTALQLAQLYAQRWEQEMVLKEVKNELQGRVTHLRSQSPLMVLQELDALLLGHYVVRSMILEAARQAGVAPIEIPLTLTLRIIQIRLGEMPADAAGYARWYAQLIEEIAQLKRRPRRLRSYPRVRKVVRCGWPVKKPEHQQQKLKPLRKRLKIVR